VSPRRVSVLAGPTSAGLRRTYAELVRRAWGWMQGHQVETDVGLAALVLIATLGQSMADPAILAVSTLLVATIPLRRRYPVPAFAAALLIAVLQVGIGLQPISVYSFTDYAVGAWQPTVADVAVAVLLYTLAAHTPRRTSIGGLCACLVLSAIAIARWPAANGPHPEPSILGAAALLASVCLTAWVLGDSVAYRYRVAYYAALEERAARLETERDAQARIAAAAERARELQERRALAVDESAARLRRIERDLHDGAQVRLAALALALGEIKEDFGAAGGGDASRTRMLIGAAHASAKEALAELRDLARGIHPAALDRGLDAALSSLTESSPTPVELTVTISQRPSPAIETIAYFCAAELLANVAKHSHAAKASIVVTDQQGELVMRVADDGIGGARAGQGSGLAGLRERVQTVDGHLGIDSPAGGPTEVTIVLPGHA
jgi:signal transduction histidine kinase